MRRLLTVTRYELLMQIKSFRFKAMCVLAGFLGFGMFQGALWQMRLDPFNFFLDDEVLPVYLIAIVLTGLFSIGRIRTTGMHSILMVRPFHTFTLVLGQTIAALLSLLVPTAIIFFPAGLMLRWQYQMHYPLPPLFFLLLFCILPAVFCILSVTAWVRTCFKNNIMAIIILGIAFAAMAICADKFLDYRDPITNVRYHNFVPLVSIFSEPYWKGYENTVNSGTISFRTPNAWIEVGLSALCSCLFLLLSCYHMRRTEPQRKVLGSYGRRWYHTPTFIKIAFDLKIDPHLRWRSHALLAMLLAVLVAKSAWPVARPYWDNWRTKHKMDATSPVELRRYDANSLTDDMFLRIEILHDEQAITIDAVDSTLTFRCDADTSGTLAILAPFSRGQYEIREVLLENRRVPIIRRNALIYMEGAEFESLSDGEPHNLTIRAEARKPASALATQFRQWVHFTPRGYYFVHGRKKPPGSDRWFFKYGADYLWTTNLNLTINEDMQFLEAPVEPSVVENAEPKPKSPWKRGSTVTYRFQIPKGGNNSQSRIRFFHPKYASTLDLDVDDAAFRFVVQPEFERLMTEVLELARPAIRDFCRLHDIAPKQRLVVDLLSANVAMMPLREIRKIRALMRRRNVTGGWWTDSLYRHITEVETVMFTQIYKTELCGYGPQGFNKFWGLEEFIKHNLARGLNHRFSLERKFEPLPFMPLSQHIDSKFAKTLTAKPRAEILERDASYPLFQMLYLVLEHDQWMRMMRELKPTVHSGFLTVDVLQKVAETAHGEKLDWFFDYWCRTGADLPIYRVDQATFEMFTEGPDEETRYRFTARITNEATGRMPVPVRLDTAKGPVNDRLWIGPGETATWEIVSKYLPMSVVVDPDGWVLTAPRWIEKNKSWETTAKKKAEMKSDEG